MYMVRLSQIDPLVNATSLLTRIADDATIKLSPDMFTIIAPHRSSRFVAVLKLPRLFFSTYSVHLTHTSKFSLHSLYTALLDGSTCPSMTIHILETINRMVLRFENANRQPEKRHELRLTSPVEELAFGRIYYGRFFSIDYERFSHLITKFSIYPEEILCVTFTDSHVKFSTPYRSLVLSKERGHCTILGSEEGVRTTQFLITIQPMLFFIDLINQSHKVWFFKTFDSRGMIRVPFDTHTYVVYFAHLDHMT